MMGMDQPLNIEELLIEVRSFIPNLLDACVSVAEKLYHAEGMPPWDSLGEVIQGMDDLYRTINTIREEIKVDQFWSNIHHVAVQFLTDMSTQFSVFNRYIDRECYREAGDCILYELIPVFQNLKVALGEDAIHRMNRLERNMACLKSRFPRAYAQLVSIKKDSVQYQLTVSRDGSPNLCVIQDEENVTYLYSRYEPMVETARWAEKVKHTMSGKENALLYGFGFGYHLSQLGKSMPDLNLYVFEPDPNIILSAMEVVDLTPLLTWPQLKDLAVGHNKDHRDGLIYRMMKYSKGETATLSLPIYDKLDRDFRRVFLEDVKNAILNYVSAENNQKSYGLEWTRNKLFNMIHNINTPSIAGLKGKFQGKPAIIAGSGPSLEKDIELLRRLKDHVLIIAAGSSVRSLQHFGIEPHMVVSMDGGEVNAQVFQNVNVKNIPFLYVPQVEHHVIDGTSDHLFHVYFNTDTLTFYLMGLREGDPVFLSNHSVTGTAIQAAALFGCNEIIFTGQDLSYPDDRVYAGGAVHYEIHQDRYDPFMLNLASVQVENVQGGYNRTSQGLKLTLADLEDTIGLFPGIRFINTSNNGAKIKHTHWESMTDVYSRLKEQTFPADELLQIMRQCLMPYSEERQKEAIGRIFNLPQQISEFEQLVKRVSRNIGKLREVSRTNPNKCSNIMIEIEQDWGKAVKTIVFNTIFSVLLKKEVAHFDRELPEVASERNLIKKAGALEEVVGRLLKAIETVIPVVRDLAAGAVSRIESGSVAYGEKI